MDATPTPAIVKVKLPKTYSRAGYKKALQIANQQLEQQFLNKFNAIELIQQKSNIIDEVICDIFNAQKWPDACEISIIAIGGYGRGELFPFSDVDVLILYQQSVNPDITLQISNFLTKLWDVGLDLSHSVRDIESVMKDTSIDLNFATSLLEARFLIGNNSLYQKLITSINSKSIWPPAQFFKEKVAERQQQASRLAANEYMIEPNVKNGSGGLRDIHLTMWLGKKLFNLKSIDDLIGKEIITTDELKHLQQARLFLSNVRYALHLNNKRAEERLLFQNQTILAKTFGYTHENINAAVEQFMQQYFRTIKVVTLLSGLIIQSYSESLWTLTKKAPIDNNFAAVNNYLVLNNSNVFKEDITNVVKVFIILANNDNLKGLSANTTRQLLLTLDNLNVNISNNKKCLALFLQLLSLDKNIARELMRMNRLGVLAKLIPEFADAVGQMQYDLYHVFTVDVHTIFVIGNLRRFCYSKYAEKFALSHEIISNLNQNLKTALYLAALFHDIGKGKGGDHSIIGAGFAKNFCAKLNLPEYDTSLIVWLVENHLLLSLTAERYDINDSGIIEKFALEINNAEYLNCLYLLTVADINATNPKLWNSWRSSLLKRLYINARIFLESPQRQSLKQKINSIKMQAKKHLIEKGFSEEKLQRLWQDYGNDYFTKETLDSVVWHGEEILQHNSSLPLVAMRYNNYLGCSEIFIHVEDRQFLFSVVTHALDKLGINIVEARIFTAQNHYTLDTFLVLEQNGNPNFSRERRNLTIETLRKHIYALTNDTKEPQRGPIKRHIPRKIRFFASPTKVRFIQTPHRLYTLLGITTSDRPGVLAAIGKAFTLCNINVINAKIRTIGAKVEDIFAITHGQDKKPLEQEDMQDKLGRKIKELLDEGTK